MNISTKNWENLSRARGGPYIQNPLALLSSHMRKRLIVKANPLLALVRVILNQGKREVKGTITSNLALTSRMRSHSLKEC